MVADIGIIMAGLILLFLGAELLVRGASSLAVRIGISGLVIGLTIVAYGTSMPEMLVSTMATLKKQGNLSIGNVVGSNIFNIGAILGISALVTPLKVHLQALRFDTPIMVLTTLLFLVLFRNQSIGRLDAFLLLTCFVGYTVFIVLKSRKEGKKTVIHSIPKKLPHWSWDVFFIFSGILILAGGSSLLIHGATGFSRKLGVSEALIGLTIVAAGTSLPELATSLVAALKKNSDIAIGNVVGSNIFNILAILGVAGLIHPIRATEINYVDIGVMIGFSLALIPLMKSGFKISRTEGLILLLAFLTYMGYLIIQKT